MKQDKDELQSQIRMKEQIVGEKKKDVLVSWAAHFFTSAHRCLLSILTDAYLRQHSLPITHLEKFKNGSNLLRDLQAGLLVVIVRRENATVQVRINKDFFTLLPTLAQKIKNANAPVITSLKQFAERSDLRVCIGCQTLRTQQEIQFIGESCRCETPKFQPVVGDPQKLARLTQIQEMVEKAMQLNVEITTLTFDIKQLYLQVQRLQRRKSSPYETFIKKYGLGNPSPTLLDLTPKQLRTKAYQEFTAAMHLSKLDQLCKVKANRRRLQREEKGQKTNQENEEQSQEQWPVSLLYQKYIDSSTQPSNSVWFYEPYYQQPKDSIEDYRVEQRQILLFRRNFEKKHLQDLKKIWEEETIEEAAYILAANCEQSEFGGKVVA